MAPQTKVKSKDKSNKVINKRETLPPVRRSKSKTTQRVNVGLNTRRKAISSYSSSDSITSKYSSVAYSETNVSPIPYPPKKIY